MSSASTAASCKHSTTKPTLLFVDDEKRVLNSMRAMFRRDYNLFLTTEGSEALKIIGENVVDVVVADQRMPQMSGVEVLSAVRQQSPATIRILLTGYADLDAVEGAMNESEVYRFLSKPCAAEELRGTIKKATQIARETAASVATGIDRETDERHIAGIAERGAHAGISDQLENLVEGAEFDVSGVLGSDCEHGDDLTDLLLVTADKESLEGERQRPGNHDAPDAIQGQHVATVEMPVLRQGAEPTADRGGQTFVDDHEAGDESEVLDTVVLANVAVAPASARRPAPALAPLSAQALTTQGLQKISVVGTGRYKVSVMVYSPDEQFAKSVGRSLQDSFYTFHASNIAHLMYGITQVAPAVLITDISEDPNVLKQLMANLKQVVPELVTMVASKHRDTALMVDLINHGQVYRFIDKPLSSTACKRHVKEAIKKHIQLRDNPELTKRYSGSDVPNHQPLPAGISRLISRLGRVRNLWLRKRAT